MSDTRKDEGVPVTEAGRRVLSVYYPSGVKSFDWRNPGSLASLVRRIEREAAVKALDAAMEAVRELDYHSMGSVLDRLAALRADALRGKDGAR